MPLSPADAFALRSDFVALVIATVLASISLVALAVFALRRKNRDAVTVSFALLVGLYAIRLFSRTKWPEILLGLPRAGLNAAGNAIDDLIVLPGIVFFRRMLGQDRGGILRILGWAAAAFAVVTLTWKAISGDWSIGAAGKEALVFFFVAVLIGNLAVDLVRGKSSDARVFAAGTAIFAAFIVNGHLAAHRLLPWTADPEPAGFLIFVGFLGFIVARRSFANESRIHAVALELETARQIQESILPKVLPSAPGLEITARYISATEVGGDFYDFLVPGPGEVGALIADVSGHGVPAALVASMIQMALAAQLPAAREPAMLLARLNALFCGRLKRQFLTAAYAFVDLPGRTIRICSAGHPPPLLCRRDGAGAATVEEISGGGPLIGRFREARYADRAIPLSGDSRLILYTDGLTEARNRSGELLGDAALQDIVREHLHLPAGPFADRVIAAVRHRAGGIPFDDDVTLVVIDCGVGPIVPAGSEMLLSRRAP